MNQVGWASWGVPGRSCTPYLGAHFPGDEEVCYILPGGTASSGLWAGFPTFRHLATPKLSIVAYSNWSPVLYLMVEYLLAGYRRESQVVGRWVWGNWGKRRLNAVS